MKSLSRSMQTLILGLALLTPTLALAQDKAPEKEAPKKTEPKKDDAKKAEAKKEAKGTSSNPELSLNELGLKIRPLTKDDLVKESAAWLKVLKAKVVECSDLELASMKDDADRAAVLAKLAKARESRSAVAERTKLVLMELKDKGGKVDD
ncbi:MAG: hypothetical protein P1V97_10000, partial [Planctomycetota bacterium]|nr:hypothetical protein [Planctomycetota bacterium]